MYVRIRKPFFILLELHKTPKKKLLTFAKMIGKAKYLPRYYLQYIEVGTENINK